MSEVYRGGRIPRDLPPGLKKLIENYDRVLSRNSTSDTINVTYSGGTSTPPASSSAGSVSQLLSLNMVGNVYTLPVEGPGKIRVYRFPHVGQPGWTGTVTLKDSQGNLRLEGDFTPRSANETITLISDGQLWWEIGRSSSGAPTFIPAALWGATPHATADRTTAIQAAINNVPLGSTLYFAPGTYMVSSPITCSRSISIWADGVIWNFGANLSVGQIGFAYGTSAGRVEGCLLRGLQVRRAYVSNTWSSVYTPSKTGMSLCVRSCQLEDLSVLGFDYGIVFDGANASTGCDYNTMTGGLIQDCRYQLVLHQDGTGWVNDNTFTGVRMSVSSTFAAADVRDPTNGCEMVWLKWDQAAAGTNGINNNRFIDCAMEPNSAVPVKRKVRIEGYENYFLFCRYEVHNTVGACDITIGKSAVAVTNMTRNVFFHGQQLHIILDSGYLEFIGTTTNNNRNQFFTGWQTWMFGGLTGDPVLKLANVSGDTQPAVQVASSTSPYNPALNLYAGDATIKFAVSGTEQNALSVNSASPYDLVTQAGLDIGGVSQFRASGSDLTARATNGANSIRFIGGGASAPPVKVSNTGSSNNDSLVVADSTEVARLILKAQDTGYTGVTSLIKFCDDDGAATVTNALGVSTTVLPGGSGNYPLKIDKGVIINNAGVNSDTQIQGENDANALYVDANTDRVGIGTATPGAKLDVAGSTTLNSGGTDNDTIVRSNGDDNCLVVDGGNDCVVMGAAAPVVNSGTKCEVIGPMVVCTDSPSSIGFEVRSADGTNTFFRVDTDAGEVTADALSTWIAAGRIAIAADVYVTGFDTPGAWGANQDNWAASTTLSVFRISASAAVDLTGITNGSSGRVIVLINVGTFIITLKHDATSTAANRFYCPGGSDTPLDQHDSAILWYDGTNSRWRIIGGAGIG